MDPITLAVGALIAAVSFITGRRFGHPKPTVGLTSDQDRLRKPMCSCTHTLAFHDPATNECHGTIRGEPLRYDRYDEPTAWKQLQCPCRQYDGPVPPDQIVANFRPTQMPSSPSPEVK